MQIICTFQIRVIQGLAVVRKSYLVHVVIYENMIASFLFSSYILLFLLAFFKGLCASPTERPDSGVALSLSTTTSRPSTVSTLTSPRDPGGKQTADMALHQLIIHSGLKYEKKV